MILEIDVRLNGEDQTSCSSTAKQKEEGAFSHKCHNYYTLYIDYSRAYVFSVL